MTATVVMTLTRREVVRFVRQRSRLVGALAQPVVFWILIGAGLRGSFRPPGAPDGMSYAEYFFPGMLALALLFSAIFATISVVEDRRSGFLQGVLVAPVSRAGIVVGQACGSTVLAGFQASLLLVLAPAVGVELTPRSVLATIGILVVLAFAMSGLGLLLAWRLSSTQGFHAIMNLLLMPMWLLSGAFFPAQGAPRWLEIVMTANPLTYGMAALRRCLYLDTAGGAVDDLPALLPSLGVIVAFGVLTLLAATMRARKN